MFAEKDENIIIDHCQKENGNEDNDQQDHEEWVARGLLKA